MDANELEAIKVAQSTELAVPQSDVVNESGDGSSNEPMVESSNTSVMGPGGEPAPLVVSPTPPTMHAMDIGDGISKSSSSPGSIGKCVGSGSSSVPTTPVKTVASSPVKTPTSPQVAVTSPNAPKILAVSPPKPQDLNVSPKDTASLISPIKMPVAPPAETKSSEMSTLNTTDPTEGSQCDQSLQSPSTAEPDVGDTATDSEKKLNLSKDIHDCSATTDLSMEEDEQPATTSEEPVQIREEDEDKHSENMEIVEAQDEQEKTPKDVIIEKISAVISEMEEALASKEDDQMTEWFQRLTELRTYADQNLDSSLFSDDSDKGKKGKRSSGKQSKRRSVKKEKTNNKMVDYLNFSLKDIKGLPVFAKWPHSGWFYPGVVKDMTIDNWKNSSNVTVMFYDGLERDMKSVHILPAELIPASSILFDLDDEGDVTVVSSSRDGDWVTFCLSSSEQPDNILERGFDKLAIKGASMKNIKSAVETTSPETPQENVSGKRMRGKSSLFTEDYVSSASRSKKRNLKTSDEESTEATSSRNSSKRRQVNGSPTKSTPRRRAAKGK